ncbi:hypothetical protein UPYG_G00186810 [Umbra pygmaea]|uniref:SCP domain-containing protein n=1 Tax=Umbra pygmaea TaxID=75934 RepID=A0ABD0WSL1_UMBPY
MAGASFEKEFLDTHNAYRKKHGSPPMTLSREVCNSAQKWADEWIKTKNAEKPHSNSEGYGENIYRASTNPTAKQVVDKWYSEIQIYDFSKPGYQPKTGHFTQVVWKESTELGVGVANDGKTYIVVGQYKLPGNINTPEYYEKNVTPAE